VDPAVLPCRRDGEGANPVQRGGITHPLPVGAEVVEMLTASDAPDAGLVVRRVHQPGLLRGLRRRVGQGAQAALGGVTPGPPHPGCIVRSRLLLRAHSRAISSSREVFSLHGTPSCQRLACTSSGSTSSHPYGRATWEWALPSCTSRHSCSLMFPETVFGPWPPGRAPAAFRRPLAPRPRAPRACARG